MSYQAIIFDLDGTLIDSERVWYKAYAEFCEKQEKEYLGTHHAQMMGRSKEDALRILQESVGVNVTMEELNTLRAEVRRRLFDAGMLVTKTGVQSFLAALVDKGYALGVATASPREYREKALAIVGIERFFAGGVSAEEVEHPKPHPDIYLKAAKSLGVDPARCLAVEDAAAGVESARAAGMDVLGVRDRRFVSDLPGVKKVIDDFSEITAMEIERL